MNIKTKYIGFKKNIKKHDLIFNCNIRAYTMLSIGHVDVRGIPFSCSLYLNNLHSSLNRAQEKFNQVK